MIRSFEGKTPRIAESAFVSEAAYVIGDVEIGENSGVFPGAVIRGDFARIKIGNGTMVEDGTIIHSGSDVEIGDNCTIGHSVVAHGTRIGNNCLIGNNATILDNAKVGNHCVIAAGSLIPQGTEVPDYSMVMGIPGVIKEISPALRQRLQSGNQAYAQLLKRYKKQPELGSELPHQP
ncbi:MAG: gamma carbonic anhydrase family protein [Dehalococcoidia bacterium]|nr:gamma carbonic anhydrase family protein [Dehalococcoidia bacterium]